MAKRVSLTKAQRESAIGAELLVLCQSVTEDGTLSLDEIKAIVRWLNNNRNANLPAKDFLFETAQRIVADRTVTREEQRELYQAIEIILPPDARKQASQMRKEFEAEIKHREKLAEETRRESERHGLERDRPEARADFMVAGVHYEDRDVVIETFVNEGDPAFLARDPLNRFSRHAVEVRISNGLQIGFVPEEEAVNIAPYLDQGYPHWACIKKLLMGGNVPIPVVLAYIYRPDSIIDGIVFPHQVPAKATLPPVTSEQKERRDQYLDFLESEGDV